MIKKLYAFLNNNKLYLLIICCISCLIYGIKLFSLDISIDNESAIVIPDGIYHAWMMMGRFGLVGLKYIFGIVQYNPYLASVLEIILLIICCCLYLFLFEYVSNKKFSMISKIIFSLLIVSAPIMAEQLSFVMQGPEVLFGACLIALALLCIFYNFNTYKFFALVASVPMLFFAFSIYQALIPLFCVSTVVTYVLYSAKFDRSKNSDCWVHILKIIVVFLVTCVLYFVINKILQSALAIEATEYTSDQVLWLTNGLLASIINIIKEIYGLVFCKLNLCSIALVFALVINVVLVIYFICSRKKHVTVFYLACLFMLVCPFLMIMILGGHAPMRTNLCTVFYCASVFVIFSAFVFESNQNFNLKKSAYFIFIVLSFGVIFSQAITTSRLYYTEHITNVEQEQIATKISDRIEKLTGEYNKPLKVAFVGRLQLVRNPSCFVPDQLELCGRSFYEISFSTAHGSGVMTNYMHTLGYNYQLPTSDEIVQVDEFSRNMNSWPSQDSVAKMDNGVIVVKLSD